MVLNRIKAMDMLSEFIHFLFRFFTLSCVCIFPLFVFTYVLPFNEKKRKSMYKSEADRGQWKSSRSPLGSRSRSADLSPRRGRWGKISGVIFVIIGDWIFLGFDFCFVSMVFFMQVAGHWQCVAGLLYISCNLSRHLQKPVFAWCLRIWWMNV